MDHLHVTYRLDVAPDAAEALAEALLLEQTVETPRRVAERDAFVREHLLGYIHKIHLDDKEGAQVVLALPLRTASADPSQFLNVLFGVLNVADAAGVAEMAFGAGRGRMGLVLMLTFGTGIGSGLFIDGILVPNTELGHLIFHGDKAEAYAADSARKRDGLSWEKWAERVQEYLDHVEFILAPDLIILGGGISRPKKHQQFLHLIKTQADAAGVAEMAFGAGRGRMGLVLMLTFGTGIGSGLFIDGILVPNTELGHLIFHGDKAEAYAADSARKRDGLSWEKWAERVQEYLDHVEFILAPDLIILGGGISRPKKHQQFLHLIKTQADLVPAQLQNEAGIIGAASAARALADSEHGG